MPRRALLQPPVSSPDGSKAPQEPWPFADMQPQPFSSLSPPPPSPEPVVTTGRRHPITTIPSIAYIASERAGVCCCGALWLVSCGAGWPLASTLPTAPHAITAPPPSTALRLGAVSVMGVLLLLVVIILKYRMGARRRREAVGSAAAWAGSCSGSDPSCHIMQL